MTIAEIIEEARRLDERVRVYHADNHRMLVSALNDRANFYATHFPLLVAVAEAAVAHREAEQAYFALHSIEHDPGYAATRLADTAAVLDAALRGEGRKP